MRYTYHSNHWICRNQDFCTIFEYNYSALCVEGVQSTSSAMQWKWPLNFLTSQSSTYMYVYNYNQLTNESPIIKKEKHCHHKLFRKFSVFVCVNPLNMYDVLLWPQFYVEYTTRNHLIQSRRNHSFPKLFSINAKG